MLDAVAELELVSQIPRLRRTWLAPVLALAPDCETAERCLLAGARDVVIAPWTPAEVRLRVHRLLHIPVSLLHTGDLALDLTAREVHLGQERMCLTPQEHGLLIHLLRHAGQVTRQFNSEEEWRL